jgi:hypothetical protein
MQKCPRADVTGRCQCARRAERAGAPEAIQDRHYSGGSRRALSHLCGTLDRRPEWGTPAKGPRSGHNRNVLAWVDRLCRGGSGI